jgi:hypothetical protein
MATVNRDELRQQITDRAADFGIDAAYVDHVVHAITEQFGATPVDKIDAADLEHILDRWRFRHSYSCTWDEDDPDSECHCEVPGEARARGDAMLRESQMWAAESAAND